MNFKQFILYSVFLFSVLIGGSSSGQVQISEADSLKNVINSLSEDSTKVIALNELSNIFWDTQPDQAIMFAVEAMELGKRINYLKGVAYAMKNIGMGYYTKSDYIQVLDYWQQSLAVFDSIGDQTGVSNLLNNLGAVYYNQGDDAQAIEYYIKSLKAAEEAGNKFRIASAYLNIGNVYLNKTETHNKALDYFMRGLRISEEIEAYNAIGNASVNIGEIYHVKAHYDSALFYFDKALKAYEIDGTGSIPYALNNMGKVYEETSEYLSALKYHNEAYTISLNIEDDLQVAQSLIGIGNTYNLMENYKMALNSYLEAEASAKSIGAVKELQEIYEGLSLAYSKLNDFSNAFIYQTYLTRVNYELYNAENDRKIDRLQFAYDLEKKQGEIDLLTKDKALQDLEMQKQKLANYVYLVGIVLTVIIVLILLYSYREKVKTFKILDIQKIQIENLLLNILPKEVANELQNEGAATPKYFDRVSVLFTDFKGFTKISDGLSPNELVDHLNSFFHAFDDIIEAHNLEKIKTIGDAYMCAGGIPVPNDTHPFDIVKAALDIQDYINRKNEERLSRGEIPWNLRIGIHTGPVVAGVVGKKKYAYDIWGNTVNIASRMESNGEIGKVNISASTYNLIKDKYQCLHRGKISAKNVGEIDMYFIEKEMSLEKIAETVEVS
jgi:class 3 adenylate cyclase